MSESAATTAEPDFRRPLPGEPDLEQIHPVRWSNEYPAWIARAREVISRLGGDLGAQEAAQIRRQASVLIASSPEEDLDELATALLAFIGRPDAEHAAVLAERLDRTADRFEIEIIRSSAKRYVKAALEYFGITEGELAEGLGVQAVTVRNWLAGRAHPSYSSPVIDLAIAGYYLRRRGLDLVERRDWLYLPAPELGGRRPFDRLGVALGPEVIEYARNYRP